MKRSMICLLIMILLLCGCEESGDKGYETINRRLLDSEKAPDAADPADSVVRSEDHVV